MRVLFVPFAEGGVSHIIPLMALDARLDKSMYETAFLLPGQYHRLAKTLNMNTMDVDHDIGADGFRTEIIAYEKFSPNVVVDDCSISTFFVTQFTKKPRIPIQRTGVFPGGEPRNKNHGHSLGKWFKMEEFQRARSYGLDVPREFADLFRGRIKIVPGISTIEVLPESLGDDPTYFFAGPLVIDDDLLEKVNMYNIEMLGRKGLFDRHRMETFFNDNKKRYIVYFTFGNVAEPTKPIVDSIRYLLDNDVAVITSIDIGEVKKELRELYYFAGFLPMHYVCQRVDLMCHHCGSGTYQYPIIYELPTITIGTRCYDRDDVCLRLEELEVNKHIPAPDECEDFVSLFKKTFRLFADPAGPTYLNAKQKLKVLNGEVKRTMREFNFDTVMDQAMEEVL